MRTTRLLTATLVAVCLLTITGCDNGARDRIQSSSNMRELSQAVLVYAEDHAGQYPESLETLRPIIGERYDVIMTNPLTGDKPGYELVEPGTTVEMDPGQVMIYQLRDGNRDTSLPVAYQDGRVLALEAE